MEQLIVERNAHYLNQVDETPFTVELLVTLIGQDSFTNLSKEILEGSADLSTLNLSPTITLYTQSLKENKEMIELVENNMIPYDKYISSLKMKVKDNHLTIRSTPRSSPQPIKS